MANLSNKTLLSVKNLDFDDIKNDLKSYLSSQDTFKDYNFDGSGLSILLDVLSYNTHHMSFYSNMIANESFLDSCILRNSAVSLSKSIGYNPRSSRGAEITVDIKLNFSGTNNNRVIAEANSKLLRILKNEIFTTSKEGINFFFYSTETFYFSYEGLDENNKPEIWARNVVLREGRLKTKTFLYNNIDKEQRFIIEDENLDDRSISLIVRKSATESEGADSPWTLSTNILDNNQDSEVYFLQETYDGFYEIYFGDNVIGKSPEQGNILFVTYSSPSGLEGNDIGINDDPPIDPSFRYVTNQNFNNEYSFTTYIQRDSSGRVMTSSGAQNKESINSIKYYAPKFYETQNRAVTLNDYIAVLQKEYSGSIKSIYAWGGEDNIPPEYGKIFVSIKPTSGLYLSSREKNILENDILYSRGVVTVSPRIVDPDYLFISMELNVKYDADDIDISPESLLDIINVYIRNFGIDNLEAFQKNYYSSMMNRNILDLNRYIRSSTVKINISKNIRPIFNTKTTYTINFENSLTTQTDSYSIISSDFYTYGLGPRSSDLPSVLCYFKDDNKGKISLYEKNTDRKIKDKYGEIDYSTGIIKIRGANFLLGPSLEKYEIKVRAKPLDTDVLSKRNTILSIDMSELKINLVPVEFNRI